MCGRYVNVSKIEAIEKRFKVEFIPHADKQMELFNTNVSPGNFAPVITNTEPDKAQMMMFGFTPSWAKKKMYVFNARSEGDHNKDNDPNFSGAKGIISKPMFRSSIRKKRCLVIADAVIEGPKDKKLSKPYLVYRKDKERPFAMAGIWDSWADKETGEVLESFAIITARSNGLMQKIGHHRSPVILSKDDEKAWLNSELELSEVTALLEPFDDTDFNAYPIDAAIKAPRANGIELLKPIGQRLIPEYDYVIYEELELIGMGETKAKKRRENEQGNLFD